MEIISYDCLVLGLAAFLCPWVLVSTYNQGHSSHVQRIPPNPPHAASSTRVKLLGGTADDHYVRRANGLRKENTSKFIEYKKAVKNVSLFDAGVCIRNYAIRHLASRMVHKWHAIRKQVRDMNIERHRDKNDSHHGMFNLSTLNWYSNYEQVHSRSMPDTLTVSSTAFLGSFVSVYLLDWSGR